MEMTLDFFAFLACLITWLGPLIYNILNGRFSPLHPIGYYPFLMVYMLVPPLVYRWNGDTILHTSSIWSSDPWFLAAPMLILALAGVFYHVGVKLTKTSLRLTRDDDVSAYLPFKTVQGVSGLNLFIITTFIYLLVVFAKLIMPLDDYSRGYYWLHLLFCSFMILPLMVFQQNRRLGTLFLLMVLPAAFIQHSKASFLYLAIIFILFYQKKVLQLSKTVSALLLVFVLLTPTAVELYRLQYDYLDPRFSMEDIRYGSWDSAIENIAHREYAFESFACVYHQRQEGEPLYHGRKTFDYFLYMIPTLLWPQKPLEFYEFPSTYLSLDYAGWEMHYAPHALTSFYLDFDIPGVCLATLLLGAIMGFGYRLGLKATLRRKEAWPLIIFLCWAVNGKWLVEATIFSAIVNFMGLASVVLLIVWLSRFFATHLGSRKPAPPWPSARPEIEHSTQRWFHRR